MRLIDVDKLKDSMSKDTCPISVSYFYKKLREAPTVKPKTGKWINGVCDQCGCRFVSPSTAVTDLNNESFRQIRNEKTKAMALEILISRWNRRAE